MKAYLLFLFIVLTGTAYSQGSINNYKYVLVPEKFDFLREPDQYGLNNATKFLLEQKGFVVYIGQLPPDVVANKCDALMAEVMQRKGFLVTNLTLQLKDCQGNVVFKSKEGKSREKEFAPAYNQALREAFNSLNDTEYKYDGTQASQNQPVRSTPAQSSPAHTPAPATAPATRAIEGVLYAQAIPNGFQLVDTTPKKVLTMWKSSMPDVYINETGGIIIKKGNDYIFEHYRDGKLVSQKLEIRF